jgi:uncharacterized protein (DUF2267 family)
MDDVTFIREVAERLGCDRQDARTITSAVFQALRSGLTPKEAADVASHLPATLKNLWPEQDRADRGGWRPESCGNQEGVSSGRMLKDNLAYHAA